MSTEIVVILVAISVLVVAFLVGCRWWQKWQKRKHSEKIRRWLRRSD
jgi:predicted negative regulator of RcsB-dependent stress response